MKRLIAICLTLAAALLAGCVVTPAYRYSGGSAGYYYGHGGSAAVIYSDGYGYYPSDSYYYDSPWAPYGGASVYYYGHDGYRHHRYDGGDHRKRRLSNSVRDQYGPRPYRSGGSGYRHRLAQPRPAEHTRAQRARPARRDSHKYWRRKDHRGH